MPNPTCEIKPAASRLPSIAALLVLALLPWFLYGHTLNFEVVLDDEPYVFDNPLLRDPGSFLYLLDFKTFALSADAWGISPDVPLNFILRPVAYLTFYINLCLGGSETAGFRLVNISIHMLNGMLLFLLARRLLGGDDSRARIAAIASALLFVAHPLATESVTYIVQRFESLSTLFFLLAMLGYVCAREASSPGRGRAWMAVSLLSTLLGMLTKETCVTIPVMLLALELVWRRQTVFQSIKTVRWHLLLMPIIPCFILASQWAHTGQVAVADSLNITNGGPQVYPITHYFMTQVCAWVSYLRLIVLPVGQNFDHDYPLITSVTDWRFLASAAVVLLLTGLSWLFYLRRRSSSTAVMMLLGVLWYFITLAPSSSIVPLPDLFSEHRCYLPSVGIFLVLAALLYELQRFRLSSGSRFSLLAVSSTCLLALSFATLLRNESMRTREGLWQDALAKGSNKARVWKGLGIAAYSAGRLQEAIEHFKHATESHPEDVESWVNLCAMYVQTKNAQEGLDTARLGIKHVGPKVNLLHLLAHSMILTGRWQDAKRLWEDILASVPDHRDSHLSLAEICAQTGDTQQAMKHLRAAKKTRPLEPMYLKMERRLQQSDIASLP